MTPSPSTRAVGVRRPCPGTGGPALCPFDELTPPMRDLFSAIAADQEWANRFCGLNAETASPDSFFAMPEG